VLHENEAAEYLAGTRRALCDLFAGVVVRDRNQLAGDLREAGQLEAQLRACKELLNAGEERFVRPSCAVDEDGRS
jgi:hypothetical protein